MNKVASFVCATFMAFTLGEQSISPCYSPQYLELGRSGTINCDFGEDFLGVYWYNSNNLSDSDQILYYSDYKKDGTGYLSGEFDILPNGTLIINNVSLHHEHVFTVVMFRTKVETTVPIYVMVIVTVKPSQRFPKIDQCGEERVCLREIDQPAMLYCYVNDSRPAVNLTFATRTAYEDHYLMSTSMFQQRKYLHTTTIAVHLSMKTIVKFYVCKADEPPTLMENNHSAILVLSRGGVDVAKPVNMFVETGDTIQLNCSFSPMLYVMWIKRESEEVDHNIAYRIMWKDYQINHTYARYSLDDENSLMIHHVTVQDEGVYGCVTGDGIQEEVKAFNITVFVKPSPGQVTVDGCIENRNCLLLIERTGILTCRLHNIRPIVSLQCRFVDNLSQNKFQNGNLTYKTSPDGSSYDITYSSEYYIDHASSDEVTVECFVERNIPLPLKWPDLATELDLRVLKDDKVSVALVLSVCLNILLLIVICTIIGEKKICKTFLGFDEVPQVPQDEQEEIVTME
ncbi:uncharacterized protein [Apostichopus japonicus]|uniref:uncharacterized protein isoform X1 n=1 Tax=Stichopus japonicus TaxID=307972 RepID=UPI003AB8767B